MLASTQAVQATQTVLPVPTPSSTQTKPRPQQSSGPTTPQEPLGNSDTLTPVQAPQASTTASPVQSPPQTPMGTVIRSATVVVTNTPPVVSGVTISPSTADNADTLTCSVNASDADGDSLTTSCHGPMSPQEPALVHPTPWSSTEHCLTHR